MPIAEMTKQFPLPGLFLRFLGVVEFAGALGLILPSLLRIRPYLTPLAAGGLVIVMSGATAISMAGGHVAPAIPPFVVGCLAGLVLYVRTRVVPIREKARGSVQHEARAIAALRATA
jgi:CHASE2 domain-containing sensor protein